MSDLAASLIALAVACYGFLLIVGGPRPANRFAGGICNGALRVVIGIFAAVGGLVLSISTHVVRFIFYRPRR